MAKLLLLEDEKSLAMITGSFLQKDGHDVDTV